MSRTQPGDLPRESELLRSVVDKVPAMLAYWDSTTRCRFANEAYRRWFGVSPEWLVGRHISELLGPLYPLNLPYIEGALRGEPQEFEREIPDPGGGSSRHSLANYIPDVVDGVVRGFFVMVTDISAIKRAELALRESEERFSLAIDQAPIGMALVALDGRFVRVNQALCQIVGYTPDELAGLTFQAITHPEDLNIDLALMEQLARGEISRYQLEKRYVRKDGANVVVMLSGSALRGPDGAPRYYVAQLEDISERKRLEEKLRLAEAISSGILSISADAILSIDEDQRITMFNAGAEKIFGHSSAEAIGAPLDLLIPERFRARHRQHVKTFAAGSQIARQMGRGAEILGLRKNGEEFPASAAISKLHVGGRTVLTVDLRDITEQKRSEDEQRFLAEVGLVLASTLEFEETLRRIAELAVRDVADLCIVEVTERDAKVRRLTVACRDPSRAWLSELLMHVPLDRRRPHLMGPVLETKRPYFLQHPSAETIASIAQSDEHHRALRAADIQSMLAVPLVVRGKLLGAIAIISSTASRVYGPADLRLAEDLAQRAALSIENAELYRDARRATQARDDVLGVVAHDLRTPLSSILMHADLLRRSKTEPTDHAQRAEAIERAANRMRRLIQDLLDVTQMEAGRLSVETARVSAREVISEAVEAGRPLAASASLEVRVDVAPDLPDVCADRERLLQVFDNLLGNALKFTKPGGHVTLGAASGSGEVIFRVTDTGSGIPADDLPHLFDRFWQARKTDRRGTGLGLAIVKGVIEAHQGRIWVESTPGVGSTFAFAIPAARTADG